MSKVFHKSFFSMGTRFNAVLPAEDEEMCERLFKSIEREVIRVEKMLSYFDSSSDVAIINRDAHACPVKIDEELFSLLKSCLNYNDLTLGAFDITLRPVIERHKRGEQGDAVINEAKKTLAEKIEMNVENRTVHFKDKETRIDFGGAGKGYALEKIKVMLNNSPMESAFISFGESSIWAKGNHPNGKDWGVGIKDFLNPDESIHTFFLSDCSLSSSSNYYWDESGQLCNKVNVINPFTQSVANEMSIVSVKSGSPVEAEVLSTALLVLNDDQIDVVLDKFTGIEVIKICYEEGNPIKKVFNRI
jgi:FAD:protein FMN transferase